MKLKKAHPDVFHIMLQVLDEGQLTDSLGRRVDFRNTIVILTSNIGPDKLLNSDIGVGLTQAQRKLPEMNKPKVSFRKHFRKPLLQEFLNRIDDVIMFSIHWKRRDK